MRRVLIWAVALCVCGCGVSKDVLLKEQAKREQTEKELGQCVARGTEGEKREEGLRKDLADLQKRKSGTDLELSRATDQVADLQAKLSTALAGQLGLKAELDTCQRDRSEVSTERYRLRATLDDEGKSWAEDRGKCLEMGADRDRLRSELEVAKTANAEERGKASQLAADRDELLKQLKAEKRARAAEVEALNAKLQGQTVALDEATGSYEALIKGMKSELDKGEVTISQLKGRLTVNVLDEILFASGSAAVNPKGMDLLNRLGEILKGMEDKGILIEGHTDNVPVRGELAKVFPTNWELSAARATSVVRYLQDKVGIDPRRLSAMGLGEYRPVDTTDTKEGRARNRRIEIKLAPLESPLMATPQAAETKTPAP